MHYRKFHNPYFFLQDCIEEFRKKSSLVHEKIVKFALDAKEKLQQRVSETQIIDKSIQSRQVSKK